MKQAAVQRTEWSPSPRIQGLLAAHREARPGVGAERAIHYTRFFKKLAPRYESPHIRMAEALRYHLEQRTIRIYDDELLIGTHTEHRIGAVCHVELAGGAMLEDLFRFQKRKTNPLFVDPRHRWGLFGAMVYWFFRNVVMRAFPLRRKLAYLKDQLNATCFVINEAGGIAHFLPDYEDLICVGTDGLRRRIAERMEAEPPGTEGRDFLKAANIALDAIDAFADRYLRLAEEMGRADLVAVLENVPRLPAGTLREALQSIWFFQLLIQIESLDQGISLGRIDQYLYPLYRKEKEAGTLDEAQLRDLFCAFCIKLSEVIPLFSERVTKMFGGLPSGQALTLGGIHADGSPAENELTYVLLDVLRKLKTRQPNWHARVGSGSGAAYLDAVYGIVAEGGGSPALYNDEVIMPALVRRGFPADRVWNYATVGCVEPALPGESFTSSDAAIFNIPIALEIVLGEGRLLNAGRFARSIGKNRTQLSGIADFAQLKREVYAEMEHRIAVLKNALDAIELSNARFHPTPLASLTVRGCIASARDLTAGGARYNASGIQGVGIADLANALEAIDVLVFRTKEFTLPEIARACRRNFTGFETMRAKMKKAPKFGNDIASVDGLAREIAGVFDGLISAHRNTRGGRWMPGGYAMTCHRAFGAHMAALPSGRPAGESLADGIAPADGTDVLGPTALLNSVAHLNQERFGNGVNLNIKFDANTLTRRGGPILGGLAGGYFDQGGMQVQVNVIDPAILEDAMLHPDRHGDLLVRISGYCAYFVDLTPEMQREICERTLMSV